MSHLSPSQITHLKQRLLAEQHEAEQLINHSDSFGLSHSDKPVLELSMYDNHPGDIGTEVFERGKDIALNENIEHQLESIQTALEGIEDGTYGKCAICGADIPFKRLEAIPYTPYCIDHAKQFVSDRRPAAEDFLNPPFGRSDLDHNPQNPVEFDGEDAWQIVESWGNSNTPAMAEDREIHNYNEMYIESDENVGFVQPIESFLATDLYGNHATVVRNSAYQRYMRENEGDHELEIRGEGEDG